MFNKISIKNKIKNCQEKSATSFALVENWCYTTAKFMHSNGAESLALMLYKFYQSEAGIKKEKEDDHRLRNYRK